MRQLNYDKLVALNPTVYETITNKIGQKFDLVEHPIKGDEHPVIIVDHERKLAVVSDFFDTEDLRTEGDYQPVYMHGEIQLAYQVDL